MFFDFSIQMTQPEVLIHVLEILKNSCKFELTVFTQYICVCIVIDEMPFMATLL